MYWKAITSGKLRDQAVQLAVEILLHDAFFCGRERGLEERQLIQEDRESWTGPQTDLQRISSEGRIDGCFQIRESGL